MNLRSLNRKAKVGEKISKGLVEFHRKGNRPSLNKLATKEREEREDANE